MRADRLLAILMLLQAKGRCTAHDLAGRLEVSERTIYRDLDALGAAGVPIVVERGRQGGCRLMDGYRTDLTGFTEVEVRTLFVARAVSHLADLGLEEASEASTLKLLAALPAAHRSAAERALERVHLDAEVWFHSPEPVPHLSTVRDAVWQERRLQLSYRHGDGTETEAIVEPLGLVAKAHVWYLVAKREDALRVFRLSRVLDAIVLDEQFVRPADFNLRAYWVSWRSAFERSIPRYEATIEASPEAMPGLQRLLGEEVRIRFEQASAGGRPGWLAIPVVFERFEDARRALLGSGPAVEVIAPRELRDRVLRDAAELIALYAHAG